MSEIVARYPAALQRYGQAGTGVEIDSPIYQAFAKPGAETYRDSNESPERAQLLLIDADSARIWKIAQRMFPTSNHCVEVVGTAAEGLQRMKVQSPDVILLDANLPDHTGLAVFQMIRELDSVVPVIFITHNKSADLAIEAMKQGAFDYLFKPLDPHKLQRSIDAALEVVRQMRQSAECDTVLESEEHTGIIGACPAMLDVYKAVGRVANQNFSVLITGESGTGKEVVARAIVEHGPRANGPFLALNCAAIPEHLLESELFGHEKGSFTGADRKHVGKFEQCHGGTLFLDEIGDMPLNLQAKILRLLQEQSFERIGGSETIKTDVRLVAATHRDLLTLSEEGNFRSDLYYRLSVFTIHLPALRERGEDLTMLATHYLQRYSNELGRNIREFAPDVLERICNYSWPGNIRELQSVLKQALLQASGTVLLSSFLPECLLGSNCLSPLSSKSANPGFESFIDRQLETNAADIYALAQSEMDRILLPRVLAHARGSQHQAARLLGIARQTLRAKLRQRGLVRPRLAVGSGQS
jgi:two-component system nitrogen regulation response regulator GlnG